MLSIPMAFLALTLSPVQQAPQQPQEAATPLPGVEVAAPAAPTAETRRVCRFEAVIGSNRRTRICRDVPRQGEQDQATREFMRDSQRVRMPDG